MAVPLVIVGAGPYALSLGAELRARNIEAMIFGRSMEFWISSMPRGMLLRSSAGWHLDPAGRLTFEAFLASRGLRCDEVDPIPVELYIEYGEWFRIEQGLEPERQLVKSIASDGMRFLVTLDDATVIESDNVVVAPGFGPFRHAPDDLMQQLPAARCSHSTAVREPGAFRGSRVLIAGGRQSAFELAALLTEAGADAVDVVYRHQTPRFEKSDWSWVDPMMETTLTVPGWFRMLEKKEKERIRKRFWLEGRGRLEPWLAGRIDRPAIALHPESWIASAAEPDGGAEIALTDGTYLVSDHIILATGFAIDLARLDYLDRPSVIARLETDGGSPILSDVLESTLPGLFFTGFPAANDFGPAFGFVRAAIPAAKLVAAGVARRLAG
ncbi:MAG TPA: NAD(P)-binding domain-containing protein [Thermoanaerobaculia bacterium]|nr:NAD(P)-binding domain-containing protein [Thermoanaerobaculia bacterium]